MSNPGIIPLFLDRNGFGRITYIQIEDNLGESIHIHLNDFRFVLTLKEFEDLARIFNEALLSLDPNIECLVHNPKFLYLAYNYYNYDNLAIKFQSVRLDKLKFIRRSTFLRFYYNITFVDIYKTPHFKYLSNGDEEFLGYFQHNSFGISNKARINGVQNYLASGGFLSGKYSLVTFGNNLLIRDGMHTASSIAALYGRNVEVEIVQIINKNIKNYFNISWLLMLKINYSVLFLLFKRFVKSVILTYR